MELGLQLGWVQSAQPTMKILKLVRVKHLGQRIETQSRILLFIYYF